ncbi:hypothetical protein [Natrinema sp. DC36]|uniref:hypothetical protein n=1 Tax=Natrinema sp. DC36 TaxID=2878680 RepID=UPI001CF080AA|nr:hypothetical protein [Natrinema sp. DC36]
MVSERRERAQVILIGAIALAFIILGIVVVFNGVLYTETLSSGGTSQSASDADVIELEVEQSVSCLIAHVEEESGPLNSTLRNNVEENISKFSKSYRNTTIHSTPTAVNVGTDDALVVSPIVQNVTVIITYDSNTHSYRQKKTIEPGDCPTGGP